MRKSHALLIAVSAAVFALPLAAAAAPAATSDLRSLSGDWNLYCCVATHQWTMRINRESDGTFSGVLLNAQTGELDSNIDGRLSGDHIAFDRTGPGLLQHWTATLVIQAGRQRIVNGYWQGTGSDMGASPDFHADRPGDAAIASAAPVPPASGSPPPAPPVWQSPPSTEPGSPGANGPGGGDQAGSLFYEVWNTGGCAFTDTSNLPIDRPMRLDRVEIWYNWSAGERSAPYTLLKDGQILARGQLRRGGCDPYQASWCIAEDRIGADLQPGYYTIQAAVSHICQNSDSAGRGYIRAYGWAR